MDPLQLEHNTPISATTNSVITHPLTGPLDHVQDPLPNPTRPLPNFSLSQNPLNSESNIHLAITPPQHTSPTPNFNDSTTLVPLPHTPLMTPPPSDKPAAQHHHCFPDQPIQNLSATSNLPMGSSQKSLVLSTSTTINSPSSPPTSPPFQFTDTTHLSNTHHKIQYLNDSPSSHYHAICWYFKYMICLK